MLDRLDAVRWDELRELIRQSYEMAAAKAPRTKHANKKALSRLAPRRKSRRP
jgi:predicted DNA-binding protein (MmcQ/YjbR family)